MKHLFTLSLFLFLAFSLNAQSELIIEPGPVGTINDVIEGDTMPDGSRVDPERIYILRRDIPYVLSATLDFSGFHLQIHAEDGTADRPFILMTPGDGGDPASQVFRISGSGDLTLKGLHITGRDLLGNYNDRAVRINSENSRVVIDDCYIDDVGQAGLRVQGDFPKIYITNSTFLRMGRPFNPANGRFIDNRGVPIDTLWVENCNVYDVSSRFYRNGGGASVNWARFNQNTFWGSGQHGFALDVIKDLEFTNNIVANPIFLGLDLDNQDTLEDARFVIEIDTFVPGENNILVSNNNIFLQQEFIDQLPATDASGDIRVAISGDPETGGTDFFYNLDLQAAIDASGMGDSNFSEFVEFDDGPILPIQFMIAVAEDTTSGGEVPAALPWDMSDLNPDGDLSQLTTGLDRYSSFHDFCYDGGLTSVGGNNGQPIGNTNGCSITSTKDIFNENNILYYPNPTSNVLYVQSLENVNLERAAIFDLQGRLLQSYQPENIFLEIDLSSFSSGTYLLTLIDDNGNVSSRKIVKN